MKRLSGICIITASVGFAGIACYQFGAVSPSQHSRSRGGSHRRRQAVDDAEQEPVGDSLQRGE